GELVRPRSLDRRQLRRRRRGAASAGSEDGREQRQRERRNEEASGSTSGQGNLPSWTEWPALAGGAAQTAAASGGPRSARLSASGRGRRRDRATRHAATPR